MGTMMTQALHAVHLTVVRGHEGCEKSWLCADEFEGGGLRSRRLEGEREGES
jgi:hypothetical protein